MDSERLRKAFEKIDDLNNEDPARIVVDGEEIGAATQYGRRMTEWVKKLNPDASEELLLAARASHLQRWQSPRSEFPDGRKGYLAWRKRMYDFHAEKADAVMTDLGYDEDAKYQVNFYIHKRCLETNRDVQFLEDAACLIFLEHELPEFAEKTPEAKLIRILQKTWGKMTEQGHIEADKLSLPEASVALIAEAMKVPQRR